MPASSRAATEAQVEVRRQGAARFVHEVPARHANVRGTVGHELRDVLGADEDGFEFPAQRRGERPLAARPDFQAGVGEQFAGVFGEAPLVGEGDTEHDGSGNRSDDRVKTQKARPGGTGLRRIGVFRSGASPAAG